MDKEAKVIEETKQTIEYDGRLIYPQCMVNAFMKPKSGNKCLPWLRFGPSPPPDKSSPLTVPQANL